MEDPTPKKLSATLVEKHKTIVNEQKKELRELKRLIILVEKLDQLEHWIEDDDCSEKYMGEREEAAIEMEKLKKQFQYNNPSERHKKITKELERHTEALEYWREHERGGT